MMRYFAVTFIFYIIIVNCHRSGRTRKNVTIIGLFHPEELQEQTAFRIAVERVNLIILNDTTILPHVEEVSANDSFNISKRVCNILAEKGTNAVGIFGPRAETAIGIVKSISDYYEIPHIETRWETTTRKNKMAINLYPESKLLAQALMDTIRDMDWKSFTVVYEKDEGIVRLQELLKSHDGLAKGAGQTPFTIVQLGEDPDHRPLWKKIKTSGETHIVLDCSADKIVSILRQAKAVGMMGDYNSYVVTSLDAHTIDFEEFKFGQTNITALRMLDPSSAILQKAVQDWIFDEMNHNRTASVTSNNLKIQSALMYDAVHLFAEAWIKLGSLYTTPVPIDCYSKEGVQKSIIKISNGFRLLNFMKLMQSEGMSGKMAFDNSGLRNYFSIEILQLIDKGFKKLGSWDPKNGISYTRTTSEMAGEQLQNIKNKTFIITSRIGRPYLDFKKGEGLKGNDRFEGYSLDLIEEIAQELGFTYIFSLVPDGQYGSLDKKTGQWNGLIRELQERRADLAICDLTITYDRRSAVDFTMPFMTLGISILFSKPVKQPPEMFSFFKPLSFDVWVYMVTAYLGVSLLLYFLSRAVSTRLVAGMWWFFTLIMISSYTANLAAFLTMERMDAPITGVDDLVNQNKIKYGLLRGGSTANFFRDSNVSIYQRMWSTMESSQPSVFVKSNDEGVERVQKGKRQYAYFMESTSLEYQMERKCDLEMVGGLLDSKGYGIAMPFDSPYRTAISGAVLKMQESGKLQQLKTKWWKLMHGGGQCDKRNEATPSNELGLANVGGVFLLLIYGCSIAFLVSLLEFLWNVRKVAVQERITPAEAFLLELKFVLLCHGTTKPLRKPREPSIRGSFMKLDIINKK
ncbi:glutamate receptor ionotropic, kainate 2-like isoform X3 [Lycorma delicatula]|uniref:glutamate receptor ionotropic, kainate 2-like isoform X3 n=1 Tax=Lycorma delicatula TaxID=130591 RepID=UPI003F514C9E